MNLADADHTTDLAEVRLDGEDGAAEVRWAPRLSRAHLRRLYLLDSLGIVDDELINLVGYALEARCRSILDVHDAQRGRVHCPHCARAGTTTLIPHEKRREEVLRCRVCGWHTTWQAYQRTYQHKQLNSGGAFAAFAAFPHAFYQAYTPRQRMLAIDRLIHEFHFHILRDQGAAPIPTRSAGVNLIEGTMTEVVAFLDELAYGPGTVPEIHHTATQWKQHEQRRRALWAAAASGKHRTDKGSAGSVKDGAVAQAPGGGSHP